MCGEARSPPSPAPETVFCPKGYLPSQPVNTRRPRPFGGAPRGPDRVLVHALSAPLRVSRPTSAPASPSAGRRDLVGGRPLLRLPSALAPASAPSSSRAVAGVGRVKCGRQGGGHRDRLVSGPRRRPSAAALGDQGWAQRPRRPPPARPPRWAPAPPRPPRPVRTAVIGGWAGRLPPAEARWRPFTPDFLAGPRNRGRPGRGRRP